MAVAFEHYGQTVATAAPPQQARAPQQQPAAYVPPQAQATQAQATGQAGDWLLSASGCLLVFAGMLVVTGQLLGLTPLGNVMADDASGMGLGVIAAGLIVAMIVTFFVAILVKRIKQ